MAYQVRMQRVRGAGSERSLLVAVFPLTECPGAVCVQQQDEDQLPRGGVYLIDRDDPDVVGTAPRFDELFVDLMHKVHACSDLAAPLVEVLHAARDAAQATRPQLDPKGLEALQGVARRAAELHRAHPDLSGTFPLEALVVSCLMIFVSEEERYPRPAHQGSDYTLGRILERLPQE